MEKEFLEQGLNHNRRKFLSRLSLGVGSVALGSLLIPDLFSGKKEAEESLMRALPHFAPKAKRIIYLFQNGAPSQSPEGWYGLTLGPPISPTKSPLEARTRS